ncbi:hypothetical protein SAMN04488135_11915 [Pollutimonas bauzanensis]|uniref:TadE-like domain-containing protein n=2 Tax=Pollutimonas bauzanensis TaxID=658167 RepID=A0A1M5ZUW2_9BURK|nr:hypothetical protein SAMN04488135_11915 [Pollutimonas bauzanensis]
MVELSVAAIPLLLLGLGSIEAAQWFFAKQAASLALLEAGRAAITAHARPEVIETAFEQALTPLFAAGQGGGARQRLARALEQRSQATGAAPWRIEVLSPPAQAFLDFSDPTLAIARATGLAAINNNYLAEQDQRLREGPGGGLGAQSGLSILQANTLVLRLTYLHEPVLPGMKGLMRLLGAGGGSYGRQAMARGGYLPVMQEIALVMQSHPVNWPLPAAGKVVGPQAAPGAPPLPAASCQGLWCAGRRPAGIPPGAAAPAAATPEPAVQDAAWPDADPGGLLPPWPPAAAQEGGPPGAPMAGGDADAAGSGMPGATPEGAACPAASCCPPA